MNEFSYYFDGVRHTSTDLEFLQQLAANEDDPQSVIDGILDSKERFDSGEEG